MSIVEYLLRSWRKDVTSLSSERSQKEFEIRQGASEVKASRTGALLSLHTTGRAQWTTRDFGTVAREGYTRNPVVHRAVRLIAEAVGSVTVLAYARGEEITEHPLLTLLASPNSYQSGPDLLEAVVGYLLISGNAYLEVVTVGDAPRELYCLRPDRMKVIPGHKGWPEAYEYSVGAKSTKFILKGKALAPILHLKLFNPLSDYYGLSPAGTAQVAMDVHNSASSWAKALLDNSARPSGALVYKCQTGQSLSDEQFDRLKQELETNFQGASNAGRPLLLDGGLDWKPMSHSPKDMDAIEIKREAAREIALAFGVPTMLLGIPGDNTYSNYQEANRVFWRQTVIPTACRILKSIAAWLGPVMHPGIILSIDSDKIDALAEERSCLWRRLSEADFLTEDEKRQAVGYGTLRESSSD